MYEDLFDDVHLTVVEQPIDWVGELPLYRGHIKELPFITGEGPSKKSDVSPVSGAIPGICSLESGGG
jgi:hypothetical protein